VVISRWVRSDDAGAVAVITALCSILLFGVAALTVDIGRLWEVRRQSQSEVDLAALAGAMHLRDADKTAACTVALQYLRDNTPAGQSPGDIDSNGQCTAAGTADGQVEINSNRTQITVRTHTKIVNFGLAGALGASKGGTAAQATAEIRSPGGMDPFAVAAAAAFGSQCIHDNSNGQNRPVTAALLPRALPAAGAVTLVTPSVVGIGETPTITISGSGLAQVKKVVFGSGVGNGTNVAAAKTGTTVTVTPPVVSSPIGPVDITLRAQSGTVIATATNAISFAYITPVITSISPAGQAAGATVTIAGQHFGGSTPTVSWSDGTTTKQSPSVNVTSAGPNASLDAVIPSGLVGAVTVTVTNSAQPPQTSTPPFPYVIAVAPPLKVTAISPTSGSTAGGDTVTITGSGFVAGAMSVTFGGATGVAPTVVTSSSLTVTTPPHAAGNVNVVVNRSSDNASATAPQPFQYGDPPVVTSINPTSGKAGDVVTITGTGFTGAIAVFFGTVAATTFTVDSDTKITVTVPTAPAGTNTVDVTVSTPFGASATSNNDLFTYIVDSCGVVTGNFGYLDVPRNDATGANTDLKLNIIQGLDHIPSIYPAPPGASAPNNSTVLALPFDQKCTTADPDVILDPNTASTWRTATRSPTPGLPSWMGSADIPGVWSTHPRDTRPRRSAVERTSTTTSSSTSSNRVSPRARSRRI
jgi:Flp pilus assembly protein TadG